MVRVGWLFVLLLQVQAPASAACAIQDLLGSWILRGEGQFSGPTAAAMLCAVSARAVFLPDGVVRFSKLHSACGANDLTTAIAAGSYQFSETFCMGQLSLTDSLGYRIPFFGFTFLREPDEILAIEQHRRQKVLYRWFGVRQ